MNQLDQTVRYPFPHDPNNIPNDANVEIKDANEKTVEDLVKGIAEFYARFLSKNWRENQKSSIQFQKKPEDYPSQERVKNFKNKIISYLQAEYKICIGKGSPGWFPKFSTKYAPEQDPLMEACKELEPDLQLKAGLFFPKDSDLQIHVGLRNRTIVIFWRGNNLGW